MTDDLIRLSIGLEGPDDLIYDLEKGFGQPMKKETEDIFSALFP